MAEIKDWIQRSPEISTCDVAIKLGWWSASPLCPLVLRVDARPSYRMGWRVDVHKPCDPLWEAIDCGLPFPTRTEAQSFALAWARAAEEQQTLCPVVRRSNP